MNPPYATAGGHHAPPQQHPMPPELAHASHYHQGPPPSHEQHPHHLAPAVSHAPYYTDPRAPTMAPPRADLPHTALPGLRDHGPDANPRNNSVTGSAATLKGDHDNERPPDSPDPPSVEGQDNTRRYKLVCVQQPQRARMCGFGDKDRRPITPPPCIRLVITDKATGMEVDCNKIEHQMYVLSVDLWDAKGGQEVNLVKHSTSSPSISSTTGASFRELAESGSAGYAQYPVAAYGGPPPPQGMPYQQAMPSYPPEYGHGPYAGYNGHGGQGFNGYPPFRPDMQNVPQLPSQAGYASRYPQDLSSQRVGSLSAAQQPNGMYTRNLIGSLVSSAARLTDPDDKIGIWFVLQDLSVRTEGWFRLRFSFVNVGLPGTTGEHGTSDPQLINKSHAPILAMCFSAPFQVYSAKKFPGVCESTILSKAFAQQGIKIPIRKEGQEGKGKKGGSDDEDDY